MEAEGVAAVAAWLWWQGRGGSLPGLLRGDEKGGVSPRKLEEELLHFLLSSSDLDSVIHVSSLATQCLLGLTARLGHSHFQCTCSQQSLSHHLWETEFTTPTSQLLPKLKSFLPPVDLRLLRPWTIASETLRDGKEHLSRCSGET